MSANRFLAAYRRGYAVMPVVGDPFSAMSADRQSQLLRDRDPVLILEAASTVLADIERERRTDIVRRLPGNDRAAVQRWYDNPGRDMRPAPVPIHPLALLAATTLALGQSRPGLRSDEERDDIASALTQVGLRWNDAILGTAGDDRSTLSLMARSALWRVVEQEDWMIWSGELIQALELDPAAAHLQQAFEERTGLTIKEWWYRGFGERATRATHGARSWGGADHVDPDLESAWNRLVSTPVGEAVDSARSTLSRRRPKDPPTVSDPFDLAWLASRPILTTPDDRRFQLWIGANNRCLLPAAIAQTVSEVTGVDYLQVAQRIGRSGEELLTRYLEAVPMQANESRLAEAAMPAAISKCDYLVECSGALVGFEFTIMTPSRALGAGHVDAVEALVGRFADKLMQAYSAFEWRDPDHRLRWLPVLVLESPTVVDPLLNEQVHKELVSRGVVDAGSESELMTCHAPEFLDFLQYCSDAGLSPAEGVLEWRDSHLRGAALDWWLSDHDALRSSGRRRVGSVADVAEAVLTRSGSA
ncbi:MAG: hypothetical protein JJLCMIEE_03157 [Acidimicrobiales bacterium]|nr:MAG: hypothetical protein EDR02_12330 [Actinomycetota bacterium]MBV6510038.1 hypothetical protein [Acidimicrobiales bacterium]RIK04237.1 MAG: hypothetical protein DCC48_14195 [Acidobacteriota bacterium]